MKESLEKRARAESQVRSQGQELMVRVPLLMAEVWAEMQAQVEELAWRFWHSHILHVSRFGEALNSRFCSMLSGDATALVGAA